MCLGVSDVKEGSKPAAAEIPELQPNVVSLDGATFERASTEKEQQPGIVQVRNRTNWFKFRKGELCEKPRIAKCMLRIAMCTLLRCYRNGSPIELVQNGGVHRVLTTKDLAVSELCLHLSHQRGLPVTTARRSSRMQLGLRK